MRKIIKTFVTKGFFHHDARKQRRGRQVTKRLYLCVVVMCLVCLFPWGDAGASLQPVDQGKNVLVINSYHRGYPWTDKTLAGIESVLGGGKGNATLYVEFMDSKRAVDKNLFGRLFSHYRSKFDRTKFNLIIVSDNDAFNFILRYRDALFPGTPVVFCGVNALNETLVRNVARITGVVESYDMKATLELALKLHPNAKEIVAVNNGNAIGDLKKRLFKEAVAAAGKNLKTTLVDDPVIGDFERLLKAKDKDCIVLLLGFFKEKNGETVPVEVSTPVLAKYDVPLYGVMEHFLGYGIIGGKLISGYHQGALAARMGLRILEGESVDKVPIERKSPNVYMFDFNQMAGYGIAEGALPEGSIIVNKPKAAPTPTREPNNVLIWAALAAFACIGVIVILIALYVRSRRDAEESLDKRSVDLEKKVEARTDELMKSNAELRVKVTEMKQAETSVTESHLKYWTLFQQAPTPVFIVDETYHYSDCNAKMLEFFECTLDELRAMDARDLVPERILGDLFESGQSSQIQNVEAHLRVQGKERMLLLNLVPVVLSGKRFVYGIGRDITELKQGQDGLKSKEALLETIIDVLDGAVIISDTKGAVEYLSEGFTKTLGFTREDVPSMDAWWQKAYPDKALRDVVSAAWLQAASDTGLTNGGLGPIEGKIVLKNGTSAEKELRFIPLHSMVAAIVSDSRKPPRVHPSISRNQESIETLAAGIAHDFNNLLLVILGNISLAKTSLTGEDRALERLTDAERASMMAKDLIQQLITFSKGGELSKRVMVITPLIMEITRSTLSNTNIKGKYIMSDDLFPVEIDEGQIRQVMHIVLRNAREAMPQGGTVTISFENVRITREDYLPLTDGDYVRISLKDEGLGIKQEHIDRVFDPYFTTKDVGSRKGVGLGLAIAYSIIKKHGGHIAVESSVGGGTTFYMYLPAYGKEEITEGQPTEQPMVMTKRKGKVLVMDDAKAVRDVTGAMLSHIGYDVEFAREGREAIALYRKARESDNPFDAVILDLTVQGGMGGIEAMQLLLALDPHIKAIISSGYSGDPIMSEYHEHGFKTAILKPYKMEELQEILEKLILGAH